jgi:hypothetical protein
MTMLNENGKLTKPAMTLEQAREFFPVESGMSDEQLTALIAALDVFTDQILDHVFKLDAPEVAR